MPAARDDYLVRLIQQVAQVLRNLRSRLLGGDAPDVIAREAGEAIGLLLGSQRSLLEMLDPASASQIVGNSETVRSWSALLMLQADADAMLGRDASAATRRARAKALTPDIEG